MPYWNGKKRRALGCEIPRVLAASWSRGSEFSSRNLELAFLTVALVLLECLWNPNDGASPQRKGITKFAFGDGGEWSCHSLPLSTYLCYGLIGCNGLDHDSQFLGQMDLQSFFPRKPVGSI